jgi:hypothetical protein
MCCEIHCVNEGLDLLGFEIEKEHTNTHTHTHTYTHMYTHICMCMRKKFYGVFI